MSLERLYIGTAIAAVFATVATLVAVVGPWETAAVLAVLLVAGWVIS